VGEYLQIFWLVAVQDRRSADGLSNRGGVGLQLQELFGPAKTFPHHLSLVMTNDLATMTCVYQLFLLLPFPFPITFSIITMVSS
jgi:hypothetical protein